MNKTANQILSIPVDKPHLLFAGVDNTDQLKVMYRQLRSEWHPDRNTDSQAAEVLSHINVLHAAAEQKLIAGTWGTKQLSETFITLDGREFKLKYVKTFPTVTGVTYIGYELALFKINKDYYDLLPAIQRTLKFATPEMEKNVGIYLPKFDKSIDFGDYIVIKVNKDKDAIRLSDIHQYYLDKGTTLDIKHVTWIVTRLLNIACYLEWSKLCHNDIALDTLYVNPSKHSVYLLGGWEFSTITDTKLKIVRSGHTDLMSPEQKKTKLSSNSLDLELIRNVARTLIGDIHALNKIPKPIKTFITHPTTGSAIKDYEIWSRVVTDAFGPRKFINLDLTVDQIYQ
jgi:hypothetical protein